MPTATAKPPVAQPTSSHRPTLNDVLGHPRPSGRRPTTDSATLLDDYADAEEPARTWPLACASSGFLTDLLGY